MLRNHFPLILFLCAAFVLVSPVFAQSSLETYTSKDGYTTFSYPQGWVVTEATNSVTLLTGEDVPEMDTRTLHEGEGGFALEVFSASVNGALYDIFQGSTVVEKLQAFVEVIEEHSNSTIQLGKAAITTIGKHPGAFATGTLNVTGNALEMMLIDFENGAYGLVIMDTAPNGLAKLEPKMLSIASSVVYTPTPTESTPATGTPTPIKLNALTPISVQNAANVKALATIQANTGVVTSAAISPDGKTIASASDDGDIRLWDAATGARKPSPGAQNAGIRQLLFTPDGKVLISAGDDGTVRLWDASTGVQQAVTQHDDAIWKMALSPDGKTLAYSSTTRTSQQITSSTVRLWNLETQAEQTLATLPDGVLANSMAFSPDGKALLYSGSGDDQANAWLVDMTSQQQIGHWSSSGEPIDAFFTADSEPIIAKTADAQSYDIMLWNPQSDTTLLTLMGHHNGVSQAVLNADRTILGTASYDGTARLWDVETGTSLVLLSSEGVVMSIAFSSDGRLVVTSDSNGKVYVWGVPSTS